MEVINSFFSVVCQRIYRIDSFVCLCLDITWKGGWVSNENWFLLTFLICLRFFLSDHNNRTALHVAAMRGSKRCVECILKHHPQSINLLDKNQVSSQGAQCRCLQHLLNDSEIAVKYVFFSLSASETSDKMELWKREHSQGFRLPLSWTSYAYLPLLTPLQTCPKLAISNDFHSFDIYPMLGLFYPFFAWSDSRIVVESKKIN